MRDSQPLHWFRAFAQITTYLGVVMIGVIWSGVYFLSVEERERAVQDAQRQGGNLTRVFAEYISRAIRSTDSQLIILRKLYQRDGDKFSFDDYVDIARTPGGLTLHFSITGADGTLKLSSLGPVSSRINVGDLKAFNIHRDTKADELYISEPGIGRMSGKASIHLTRSIFASDGSFNGTIGAAIDVYQLQAFYNSIDIGTGGVISLTGFDGIIRVRGGYDSSSERLTGQAIPKARLFALYREQPTGSYWNNTTTLGELDGVRRLISYSVIEGLPLIAVVGLSEANIFQQAEAKIQDYRQVALALTAFVLIAIGIGMLRRKLLLAATAALEKSKLSLEQTNVWFNAAIENMAHGMVMFDRDQRLLVCNRRYAEMYKLSPEQTKPGTLIHKILEARAAIIKNPVEAKRYVESRLEEIAKCKAYNTLIEMSDGRVYAINHQPMQGGGWVALHQDATDRQQAERELDRTRRFLNTIIEHVPISIIVKEPLTQKFILVNRAYEEFIGIPRERLIGATVYDIYPPQHAEMIAKYDYEVVQGNQQIVAADLAVDVPSKGPRILTTTRLVVRDHNDEPQYLIAVIEDSTNRKQFESQISFMAHHDLLTGLSNRALFLEKLQEAGERLRRRGEAFTIFMLDLDRFKDVNDSLGHHIGDELLKEAAHRLRASLRDTDTLARLGGDEFAIIQTGQDEQREAAIALAIRLIDNLNEAIEIDGHKLSISTSIGIALAPEEGTDSGDLLKKADMALYRAKAEGRNSYAFFDPAMTAQVDARHNLESDLRAAIAGKQFELHYQPIIDVKTQKACAFEALVRWRHPRRGLISPQEFIPLAEETGLIIPLGEWVLQQAFADAVTWPASMRIAINLSPGQFKKGNLLDVILCLLVEYGLSPQRVELEITESVLFENEGRNVTMMHQLKNLGISIALDDFGTGYSSLSYLTMFPFDKIKIDKSFTLNMTRNPTSAAIIAAVLSLGRSLEVATTAEGVETYQEYQALRVSGVDFVQGFLFSRPCPMSELDFDKVYDRDFANVGGNSSVANVA
jgi:diguanylate cyclase (GGDEF)-like protein/PAS domain S-box-containing protein